MTSHPADTIDLPPKLDDITPAFVTAALRVNYPGTEVTSVHVGSVSHGTATRVRLLLEYNAAGHEHRLPPTMYLKGGFESHGLVSAAYLNEVRFYRDVAPSLDVNVPDCYFAGVDAKGTGQAVLLLGDLLAKNVTFGRATEPVDADTMAALLEYQARFHARWWGSTQLESFPLGGSLAEDRIMLRLLQPDMWNRAMAMPWALELPVELHDRTRFEQLLVSLWDGDLRPPHCFVHGDCHLGNIYFERDRSPGFYDWQRSMRGVWAHDVTYTLVGSMTVEDRRRHERDLLAHYLDRLAAYGAHAPSIDEVWLQYRRHVMHGALWVAVPTVMQPEEIVAATSPRFSAAADDLESFAAFD